jgi:hypothetical protein
MTYTALIRTVLDQSGTCNAAWNLCKTNFLDPVATWELLLCTCFSVLDADFWGSADKGRWGPAGSCIKNGILFRQREMSRGWKAPNAFAVFLPPGILTQFVTKSSVCPNFFHFSSIKVLDDGEKEVRTFCSFVAKLHDYQGSVWPRGGSARPLHAATLCFSSLSRYMAHTDLWVQRN